MEKKEEIHYYSIPFIDEETLATLDYACPTCFETSAVSCLEKIDNEGMIYHGKKWICSTCQDCFISLDVSSLLPSVDEEIKETYPIKTEFYLDEVEDAISVDNENFN